MDCIRAFMFFVLSCVCYVFVRVCLYVFCGHMLGKGWPLGSRLWCLLWVCHFPIGILGQVWYLVVSIPDLCTLTYFARCFFCLLGLCKFPYYEGCVVRTVGTYFSSFVSVSIFKFWVKSTLFISHQKRRDIGLALFVCLSVFPSVRLSVLTHN